MARSRIASAPEPEPQSRHSSAVEQLFRKQQVLGSNPSVGSTPSPPIRPIRALVVGQQRPSSAGKPEILDPLGRLVSLSAIATGVAIVAPRIRQVALGLIERTLYATSMAWLIIVAASVTTA